MALPVMAALYAVKAISDIGQARAQAPTDKYEAMKAIETGERMGANIRREGRALIGSAVRQMAGSGVSSQAGTGALVVQEIKRRSEADAMQAVLQGRLQAISIKNKSQQTMRQAETNAAANILEAFTEYKKASVGRQK